MSAERRGIRHLLGLTDDGYKEAVCGARATYKPAKKIERVTCTPCLRDALDYAAEHPRRVDPDRTRQVRERLAELEEPAP